MTWITILLALSLMTVMAVVFSFILGWADKAFRVETDPRFELVGAALPGANCGGCGYVGCNEYAEAVIAGELVNKCVVGGAGCAAALADIMGLKADASLPYRPIVHCGARLSDRLGRNPYFGEQRCAAANIVADVQGCTFGCLGFGDCQKACNYDAIHVIDGLATVDYEKCVGCGACAKACPRNIITITPFKAQRMLAVTCSNKDAGKDVMKVCNVGCVGCGSCARISSLFTIENNLSTINYEAYTPECSLEVMEACEKCPRKRLVFVGIPSKGDLEAVKDEPALEVVEPDFKTTVDDTEWRG
ncbi:MAG: RnfABCDGE type electron transport complex subunit B [Thermodesulfobacteriota bacterium]